MSLLPAADRWLYAWSTGYAAVGAASLLVPLYAVALGAGPFLVGAFAAVAAFAGVPGALVWGRLATRTGRRRPFLLVSLALSALSLVAAALVTWLPLLLAINAVLWFAVAAAAPVLTLLVVDDVAERDLDRRVGLLNAYQGYAWLAGLLAGEVWHVLAAPSLGTLVAIRVFLLACAAAATFGLVLARRWLPDRPSAWAVAHGRSPRTHAALLRGAIDRTLFAPIGGARSLPALRVLGPRRLLRRLSGPLGAYLLAATLFFTGFAVFFGPLPAYLVDLGYSTDRIFALFLVSSAASAALYGLAGDLSSRRGASDLQTGALLARSALFPAVAVVAGLPDGFAFMLAAFAGVGATWAVVAVTATGIVTRLAPSALRGDALGAYAALAGVGSGFGSLLGGAVAADHGYGVAFAAASLLVVLGAVAGFLGTHARR